MHIMLSVFLMQAAALARQRIAYSWQCLYQCMLGHLRLD